MTLMLLGHRKQRIRRVELSVPQLHRSQAQVCQSYLFLVGVTSAGLFSVRTTGFPLGPVALLPTRGTISLGWACMAGMQSQGRSTG